MDCVFCCIEHAMIPLTCVNTKSWYLSAHPHLIAQKYMSCRSFLLEHSAINASSHNNLPDWERWPSSLILQALIDLCYIHDFQEIMH